MSLYIISCIFSLFLSFYCYECKRESLEDINRESSQVESDEEDFIDFNSLTEAEFELISVTDVESINSDLSLNESQSSQTKSEQKFKIEENVSFTQLKKPIIKRCVHFNKIREVRSWPECLSEAAKFARLPYNNNKIKDIVVKDEFIFFGYYFNLNSINSKFFIYFVPLICYFILLICGGYFPFIYLFLSAQPLIIFPSCTCFCHSIIPSPILIKSTNFFKIYFKIIIFIANAKIIHGFCQQYLNI